MMKLQNVLLMAMAKKISWADAAEVVRVQPRTMRQWRARLEEHGYGALLNPYRRSPLRIR